MKRAQQQSEDGCVKLQKRSVTGTTIINHSGSSCKSPMIRPVYLSHKDNPERETGIYAS
jgi:hypothetical protein